MVAKRCELYMYFIEWPFHKNKKEPWQRNPDKKSFRLMYSNIGVSFHETVPLMQQTLYVFTDFYSDAIVFFSKNCWASYNRMIHILFIKLAAAGNFFLRQYNAVIPIGVPLEHPRVYSYDAKNLCVFCWFHFMCPMYAKNF